MDPVRAIPSGRRAMDAAREGVIAEAREIARDDRCCDHLKGCPCPSCRLLRVLELLNEAAMDRQLHRPRPPRQPG